MWHSRDICFQMNTRQCLEANGHNKANSRTALSNSYSEQTNKKGDDDQEPKFYVTNSHAIRAKKTVSISRDITVIRLDFT